MQLPLRSFQPVLELRAKILWTIRRFFRTRDFLEVETPLRLPVPAMELHIDALPAGDYYLRTSPEFHMKRLLAAGYPRLFQIGPCFRQDECGAHHHPEFTLLEWYRAAADYMNILADTKALLAAICDEVLGRTGLQLGTTSLELLPVWEIITISQAFSAYAGWDPTRTFDAERFDLDLVSKVEPNLPREHPVVLIDYPAEVAALARRKPAAPALAERWELYIGGLEIANAFSELTDAAEQRARFVACAAERQRLGKPAYPLDEDFLAALEAGLPPCAGIALGVDRLIMLLAGARSLDEVLPFR